MRETLGLRFVRCCTGNEGKEGDAKTTTTARERLLLGHGAYSTLHNVVLRARVDIGAECVVDGKDSVVWVDRLPGGGLDRPPCADRMAGAMGRVGSQALPHEPRTESGRQRQRTSVQPPRRRHQNYARGTGAVQGPFRGPDLRLRSLPRQRVDGVSDAGRPGT